MKACLINIEREVDAVHKQKKKIDKIMTLKTGSKIIK